MGHPALLIAPSSLSHAQGRGVVHLPVGVRTPPHVMCWL